MSKARLRAWLEILKVSRSIEARLRENLRTEFDSTLPRFDVLSALERSENGLRMSELSDALMVSNGNVTGIVDRLVQEGSIERLPVEGDRRASIVRLTGTGRARFSEMARVHEGWIDELLGGLSADDIKQLSGILRSVRQSQEVRT
ncbi:MAG: MarR family winged helix-turn-helix transcriptional regulator [Hyphomicrobiaceae bacterium]